MQVGGGLCISLPRGLPTLKPGVPKKEGCSNLWSESPSGVFEEGVDVSSPGGGQLVHQTGVLERRGAEEEGAEEEGGRGDGFVRAPLAQMLLRVLACWPPACAARFCNEPRPDIGLWIRRLGTPLRYVLSCISQNLVRGRGEGGGCSDPPPPLPARRSKVVLGWARTRCRLRFQLQRLEKTSVETESDSTQKVSQAACKDEFGGGQGGAPAGNLPPLTHT